MTIVNDDFFCLTIRTDVFEVHGPSCASFFDGCDAMYCSSLMVVVTLVVVALVMVLEVVVWKTVCWTPSGRAAPVGRGTPSAPVVQILLLLQVAATVCIASVSNLKPLGSPLVLQIVLLRLALFSVRSTMLESNCENMETNK